MCIRISCISTAWEKPQKTQHKPKPQTLTYIQQMTKQIFSIWFTVVRNSPVMCLPPNWLDIIITMLWVIELNFNMILLPSRMTANIFRSKDLEISLWEFTRSQYIKFTLMKKHRRPRSVIVQNSLRLVHKDLILVE